MKLFKVNKKVVKRQKGLMHYNASRIAQQQLRAVKPGKSAILRGETND
jgi:hypothetical protein